MAVNINAASAENGKRIRFMKDNFWRFYTEYGKLLPKRGLVMEKKDARDDLVALVLKARSEYASIDEEAKEAYKVAAEAVTYGTMEECMTARHNSQTAVEEREVLSELQRSSEFDLAQAQDALREETEAYKNDEQRTRKLLTESQTRLVNIDPAGNVLKRSHPSIEILHVENIDLCEQSLKILADPHCLELECARLQMAFKRILCPDWQILHHQDEPRIKADPDSRAVIILD